MSHSPINLVFGTGNKNKLREARMIFDEIDHINLKHIEVDRVEIQANNVEDIALYSLNILAEKKIFFVEDTGLFIDALSGFPGPYASYVSKTISNKGILKLMENIEDRKAHFKSAIAYRDSNAENHVFIGKSYGTISYSEKGSEWGFDPIFIPETNNPDQLTFAQMSENMKNDISHGSNALKSFANFLVNS